jgi:hypothetical protein
MFLYFLKSQFPGTLDVISRPADTFTVQVCSKRRTKSPQHHRSSSSYVRALSNSFKNFTIYFAQPTYKGLLNHSLNRPTSKTRELRIQNCPFLFIRGTFDNPVSSLKCCIFANITRAPLLAYRLLSAFRMWQLPGSGVNWSSLSSLRELAYLLQVVISVLAILV